MQTSKTLLYWNSTLQEYYADGLFTLAIFQAWSEQFSFRLHYIQQYYIDGAIFQAICKGRKMVVFQMDTTPIQASDFSIQ